MKRIKIGKQVWVELKVHDSYYYYPLKELKDVRKTETKDND